MDIRDANELDSVDVLFRRVLLRQCGRQLDFLFGYRYGRFSENLSVDSSTTFVSGFATPDGTVSQVSDLFAASNEFNGAELGFAAKTRCCRLSIGVAGQARHRLHAIPREHQRLHRRDGARPAAGDLMPAASWPCRPTAAATKQSGFSVVPELGLNLGYDFTCRLRATFGYTLMYWSRVARPGDLVDTNVESVPVPARATHRHAGAAVQVRDHGFLAQGLSLGLDYRF